MVPILHSSAPLPELENVSSAMTGNRSFLCRSSDPAAGRYTRFRHCHDILDIRDPLLVFPYSHHPSSHLVKCCEKPLSVSGSRTDCPDVCKTAAKLQQTLRRLELCAQLLHSADDDANPRASIVAFAGRVRIAKQRADCTYITTFTISTLRQEVKSLRSYHRYLAPKLTSFAQVSDFCRGQAPKRK